ncbi:MAG: hypothetical protein E6Q97_17950 [Desulfurellales bacterium]|nr:MAG: hypothetical protein E6Q97_17950 [Desulfurellales bacterium]
MPYENLTSLQVYEVEQQLIWGSTPREIQHKLGIAYEDIAEIIERSTTLPPDNVKVRRALALARIDALGKLAMEQAQTKDMGAIRAWIELQKREAALTGMDAPTQAKTEVNVSVAWVQPGRLAYKEGKALAADIGGQGPVVDVPSRPVLPPIPEDDEL